MMRGDVKRVFQRGLLAASAALTAACGDGGAPAPEAEGPTAGGDLDAAPARTVELTTPAQAEPLERFLIDWSGAFHPGDQIELVPADQTGFDDYLAVRSAATGAPQRFRAPYDAGDYKIRYSAVDAEGRRFLIAERPFAVTAPAAPKTTDAETTDAETTDAKPAGEKLEHSAPAETTPSVVDGE